MDITENELKELFKNIGKEDINLETPTKEEQENISNTIKDFASKLQNKNSISAKLKDCSSKLKGYGEKVLDTTLDTSPTDIAKSIYKICSAIGDGFKAGYNETKSKL